MTKTFKQVRENYVGPNVSQKLSYDKWLKQVKGIKKGAHGVKGNEHSKFTKQWKDYRGNDKLAAGYMKEQTEFVGEGYENNMITHLGELGIDVSFRLGKMIVHKSDLQRVKDALKDGIADRGSVIAYHRMPQIKVMGEEVKEAKTAGGALAQGHLETMTDQRFKEFYGMTKDEYIKKHGDPTKEELEEALEVKWDANKQGWFDKQGKRRYLGKMATNKLMSKAIDKAKASGDWVKSFDLKHGQLPEETELVEGRMKELHSLIQQGKSAEEIAKIMKLDVKTIKSLMPKEANDKAYAIGMAKAKEIMKDEPPLEKKTISKAHDIAKAIIKREQKMEQKEDMKHGYDDQGKSLAPVAASKKHKLKAQYENKYFDTKPNSIEAAIQQMNATELQEVTIKEQDVDKLVKQYLAKGGTITKLPPALAPGEKGDDKQKAYKVKKDPKTGTWKILKASLREFIKVYNDHFLTNYAAEDFIVKDRLNEKKDEEDFFDPITEACWAGYKQVGMKDKGGRQVPNCVPDPDNKIPAQKKEEK